MAVLLWAPGCDRVGAAGPTGAVPLPEPPPTPLTTDELLRRITLLAERGTLLDFPFLERALGVAIRPLGSSGPAVRDYSLLGTQVARPSGSSLLTVRPSRRSPGALAARVTVGIPESGPCVTLDDAVRAFGPVTHRAIGTDPPPLPPASDVDVAGFRPVRGDPGVALSILFRLQRCAWSIHLAIDPSPEVAR
jgi:hypothetical protein